jgi:hypothetical protein
MIQEIDSMKTVIALVVAFALMAVTANAQDVKPATAKTETKKVVKHAAKPAAKAECKAAKAECKDKAEGMECCKKAKAEGKECQVCKQKSAMKADSKKPAAKADAKKAEVKKTEEKKS